jgi:hypothetical protein
MKTVRYSLAIPVSALVAGLVFLCLDSVGQRLQWPDRPFFPLFALLNMAGAIAAGFFAGRAVSGLHDGPFALWRRIPALLRVGIVAAYFVTWAVGVPAVFTQQHSAAVAAYKEERARNNRVWETHPRIRTSIAFPVLPGAVVSYHEYQVAGLDGWGGWQVHVWYVVGVKQILERTHWIS